MIKRQRLNGDFYPLKVNLPTELVEKVRIAAFRDRVTISFWVRQILEKTLSEIENEKFELF